MAKKSAAKKKEALLKWSWKKSGLAVLLVLLAAGGFEGWKHRADLKALADKVAAKVHLKKAEEAVAVVKPAPAKEEAKVAPAEKSVVEKAVQAVKDAVLPAGQPKYYDAILFGGISSYSGQEFSDAIAKAALDHHDVWVRISSPGGSAFGFLVMVQSIEDTKKQTGMKLHCVADILAASAAFYTLESVCDERIMTNRTVLLAHGIQGGAEGNLTQMEDEMQLMRALEEMVAPLAAPKMGMSKEEFLAWIYGRNRWMGPTDAVKMKAVDRVADANDLPAQAPPPAPAQEGGG